MRAASSSSRDTKELDHDTHIRPSTRRAAREDPPRLRRRADRRQFLRDRRWRGGGARRVRRLRRSKHGKAPLAPPRRGRGGRRAAGDHGHRPGAGDPGGGREGRPEARRHRPLRDQRGVRRAGDGLRARARSRRGQAQRQRRRDRDRPSARRDRRAPLRHARARIEALGPALRHRVRLHRRRAGHRAADRESPTASRGRH